MTTETVMAEYAKRGLALIPLCWPTPRGACGFGHRDHDEKQVGKVPLVQWRGLVANPPTSSQSLSWLRAWPEANIAALVEPARGLVVDADGDEALGEATGLGLPPAWVSTTGRGSHYFYRAPAHVIGRCTTKRGHSRAIDVLAGGLVTVPPSRHRSGRQYTWIIAPWERALVDAPAWAVRLLEEATVPGDAPGLSLPVELPIAMLDALAVAPRIKRLIDTGADARYRSRSEAVFGVIQALIVAGHDDATIAGVLEDDRYGISAKPRELGRRWLAHEIRRARAKADVVVLT